MARELFHFSDTKFIFRTNFAGDPAKDKYRSDTRKGNIIITEAQAEELKNNGYNVKEYEFENNPNKPRSYIHLCKKIDDNLYVAYYIPIRVKFGEVKDYWPKIYLVSGGNLPVRLYEDTLERIDDIWVESVDCTCAEYESEKGKTLWVRSMYVNQSIDEDPYAEKYFGKGNGIVIEDDLPFTV